MKNTRVFKISKDRQTITSMYSDDFDLKNIGCTEIITNRASNIEMNDNDGKWYIDLSPIGGGIVLQGFEKRTDALAREIEIVNNWLMTGELFY